MEDGVIQVLERRWHWLSKVNIILDIIPTVAQSSLEARCRWCDKKGWEKIWSFVSALLDTSLLNRVRSKQFPHWKEANVTSHLKKKEVSKKAGADRPDPDISSKENAGIY